MGLTICATGIGNIVARDFTPVLAKHTNSFNVIDTLAAGVDRIQKNFEPLQRKRYMEVLAELKRKTR